MVTIYLTDDEFVSLVNFLVRYPNETKDIAKLVMRRAEWDEE